MPSDCFLDTNILIYAAAGRDENPEKFEVAARLVQNERFGLSGQVLAEFYVIARTKPAVPLSFEEACRWVDLLSAFPVASVDELLVRQGIAYADRFKVSYWDGAIIAAAERLQAPILYTEDLNHNQVYGSVRVINPFRASAHA